jgi:Skp family chaperone for outer membrane proteins
MSVTKPKNMARFLKQHETLALWLIYTEADLCTQIAAESILTVGEFKGAALEHFKANCNRKTLFNDKQVINYDIEIHPTPKSDNETLGELQLRNGNQVPGVVFWPLPDGSSPLVEELVLHRQSVLLRLEEVTSGETSSNQKKWKKPVTLGDILQAMDNLWLSHNTYKNEIYSLVAKNRQELDEKNQELDEKNQELAALMETNRQELDEKNQELDKKNQELKKKDKELEKMIARIYNRDKKASLVYIVRFIDAYFKKTGFVEHFQKMLGYEYDLTIGKIFEAISENADYQKEADRFFNDNKMNIDHRDIGSLKSIRQQRSRDEHEATISRVDIDPSMEFVDESIKDIILTMYAEYFGHSFAE